jgi:hypothetical protein
MACGVDVFIRTSYDDTHVHYGGGGASSAAAYGLQNARVSAVLAQAACSANRA